MKAKICEDYTSFMMLVCLLKVYYDAGIPLLYDVNSKEIINEFDYFYEYVYEAIQCAAPTTVYSENLYQKYGYSQDDGDVYIWAYSSKEMQKYFRLARKLHRLEGNGNKPNPYEREILVEMESIMGFRSYNFDYFIGHKRKGAWLEVLWGYGFCCEIPMCLWIVRVMQLFREKLPELEEKYRRTKQAKRIKAKRGAV